MSSSPRILTGDQEIAQFLKVSVPHIRRHGDKIPVIRKVGNIRITSEEALQAFLVSGIGTATADEEEDENKRARPVEDWNDKSAIASAGRRRKRTKKGI